jgi:hypothetical protein
MSTSPIPRRVVGSSIHLPVHYCHLLHNQLRNEAIPLAHSTLRSAQHHYYQHATSGHSHRAVHVHHRLHVASPPSLRTQIRALFCPPCRWTGPPETIRQISPVLFYATWATWLAGISTTGTAPYSHEQRAAANYSGLGFIRSVVSPCTLSAHSRLTVHASNVQYAQFGLRLLHYQYHS